MTILSQSNSTNPGADLWVIPQPSQSRQSTRLDWYLNFQLSRASVKSQKQMNADLVQVLRKCGLPEAHYAQNEDRLLINSSHLLPNRWVIQLDFSKNLQAWCQQIGEIWTGLRKPSMRVFLPTGLSSGDFQSTWKQSQSFDDFSVVVD